MFGMDNEGESCGMRRKATERMMASSAPVHVMAERGEVSRREFDHVGSGVVKYGARMSHTLKTYVRDQLSLFASMREDTLWHTSSRPNSETNNSRCSFGCNNEVGITGDGGGLDGGGACLGGTLRFGSDDTVGFAGLTGVPSLGCPFVAIAQEVSR